MYVCIQVLFSVPYSSNSIKTLKIHCIHVYAFLGSFTFQHGFELIRSGKLQYATYTISSPMYTTDSLLC